MTIEKGMDWGVSRALPADGLLAHTDAEAGSIVEQRRRNNERLPPVGLLGGDLCRTLGGTGDEERLRSDQAMTFTVDVGAVLVDGRVNWFVAHLLARRSWWRGRTVAVMNAQWFGEWDLAPRAHPADGVLDIVDADLSFADRLKARSRLSTGTHVPHPNITTRRVKAWQTDLDPSLDIWLDGVKLARGRRLSVRVEPNALTIVV